MKQWEEFEWITLGIVKISYKHLHAESGETQSCSAHTVLLNADSTRISQCRHYCSIQGGLLNTESIAQCRAYCLIQIVLLSAESTAQYRQYCLIQGVLFLAEIISHCRPYCSILIVLPVQKVMRPSLEPRILIKF
jgi:hypothetical protein